MLVPRLNFAMIFVDLQQRQQQQQPLYLYSARNRMNKNIKVKIKRVHGYLKYYTRGNLVSATLAMEFFFFLSGVFSWLKFLQFMFVFRLFFSLMTLFCC